jgi:elongator complex protein 3
LKDIQKINETAKHRCVGLSVETRPDYVSKEELKYFRGLGVTKVEIGVQCLDDEIYKMNNRGHTVADVRKAMKLLKDAGFKINAHFMPNMYGSNLKKDFEMFRALFDDPDFRPDWLKIYPCVVVPYSPLEKLYRDGKHKTYSNEELIDLLVKFKSIVPEYCRITRLYRDIPAESIIGGSKVSNLRQYVQADMKERGMECRCIRCRELKGEDYNVEDVELIVREYESSGGKEYFVSFEDVKKDLIVGFLRLRIPSEYWIPELAGSSIIRELHVFGEHLKVGGKNKKAGQHKGYGRKLIEKAGELTKSENLSKLAVISGVGVREYYRKLGFKDGDLYQYKTL